MKSEVPRGWSGSLRECEVPRGRSGSLTEQGLVTPIGAVVTAATGLKKF